MTEISQMKFVSNKILQIEFDPEYKPHPIRATLGMKILS